MAAGLAAAIERELGIRAELVEGQGGIYEITVDGDTLYSNQSQCGQSFPSAASILAELGQSQTYTPERARQGAEIGPRFAWSPTAPSS